MSVKRIALVTGANQGVGLQVAKELVAGGATVMVGSRDLNRGEDAAAVIGSGAIALQIDVTDAASIAAAATRIRDEFGCLDLLVNNAAISNTRKQPASRSRTTPRPHAPAPSRSMKCARCGRPTCSGSSRCIRRCCRCCANRPTRASSTYRAVSAR